MNIEIVRIVIVEQANHPDRLYLHTDFPSPMPLSDVGFLTLKVDAARGEGVNYCAKNFPDVPVRVIKY